MRHIICDMIKRMYALVVNIRVSGPLSSQNSKKFKRNLKKYSEKFLIFSQKKFFLYFGKWNFLTSKENLSEKIYCIFSKNVFLIFEELEVCSSFELFSFFLRKFFFSFHILRIRTFQRIFWCIRRELSEPWNHFLYFSKWDFLAIKT